MKKIGLIPCRLRSQRLPNKPLKIIEGIPMFAHVYYRSMLSDLDEVYICTDSKQIEESCKDLGIKMIMTSDLHSNGTERCSEAADILNLESSDLIIDIQGDEPLIDPDHINYLIKNFKPDFMDIMVPFIKTTEQNNKNIVKIVSNSNGKIMYMSRYDIPYNFRNITTLKKHLSIIAFKKSKLKEFSELPISQMELIEGIELLRALESNFSIFTFELKGESRAVDTEQDLVIVRDLFKYDNLINKYEK